MSEAIDIGGGEYAERLQSAEPTFITKIVKPPPGSMSAPTVTTVGIPPLNTDIRFGEVVPQFSLSQHPGLAAMDPSSIPDVFDWRNEHPEDTSEIAAKKQLIATPPNQRFCGSCWAIAAAGVIGDNFVVRDLVDWKPEISTTWSLACYPQNRCAGGNPAKLFETISQSGVVSDHCIDYSWCSENEVCNGSALKHFDKAKQVSALNQLNSQIPDCGCYYGGDHYMFYLDKGETSSIHIGAPGVTEDNIASLVKKQIYSKGPVLAGYIIFSNFMSGKFTGINGGVYLENIDYEKSEGGEIIFNEEIRKGGQYYNGSHAISVIGWGIEKDVLVAPGKKEEVPYWYCRNSWGEKWGTDGGYFKMAMYPWNKVSQFDMLATVPGKNGAPVKAGGFVFINASQAPKQMTMKEVSKQYQTMKKQRDDKFYQPGIKPDSEVKKGGIKLPDLNWKKIGAISGILILIVVLAIATYYLVKGIKFPSFFGSGGGRRGVYRFKT